VGWGLWGFLSEGGVGGGFFFFFCFFFGVCLFFFFFFFLVGHLTIVSAIALPGLAIFTYELSFPNCNTPVFFFPPHF